MNAEERFMKMVDARIAYDVYMDRVSKTFSRGLHDNIEEWAAERAEAVAEKYPYKDGLTEEELEDAIQPVKYGVADEVSEIIGESAKGLIENVYDVTEEFSRRVIQHEYRFQRAALKVYGSAEEDAAEAADWEEAIPGLGDVEELEPFGDVTAAMAKTDPPPEKLVNAIMEAPAPWDGKEWSERLSYLKENASNAGHDVTRNRMVQAMQRGDPINKIRDEVEDSLGTKFKHKSNIITRTEVARVQNVVKESQYEAGADAGLFVGKEAVAIFDRRTCVECAGYDGQVFYYDDRDPSIDEAPIYPLHPFCRCMFVPITKGADDAGITIPRNTNEFGEIEGDFENWMRRMNQRDSEFARKWMGEEKYKEWSQGKTLADIAGTVEPSAQLAMNQFTSVDKDLDPEELREGS